MEEDDALTVDDDDEQEQDDVTDAHSIHQKLLHASASHAAATSCASQLVRQAGPFVGSPLSPHHLGELHYYTTYCKSTKFSVQENLANLARALFSLN